MILIVDTTVAFFELLESFTTKPFLGAGPVIVTVPDEDTPPETVLGLSVTVRMVTGFTVRFAVIDDDW